MDDLISRQAAIDTICRECQGTFLPCESFPCDEIEALKALPSAQPEKTLLTVKCEFDDEELSKAIEDVKNAELELIAAQQDQRWIPVSERLPKVGQTVICQCRANILKLLKLDSDGDWYQDAEHAYMKGFVIAWMPLPEPYVEKGDA